MNLSRSGRIACCLAALVWSAVTCRGQAPVSASRHSDTLPDSVTVRGDLYRSRQAFTATGKGRVAFIGGSITEMDGYRPMVTENLATRFPETEFEFTNAGIASTCSHTGAFRLPTDVLSVKPQLLFVEFAVNDDQDAGHSYDDAVRGMEGIIRAARTSLPDVDIVITHFVNPSMLQTVQEGEVPTSIRAHEAVAEHYGISTCNVAVELAQRIAAGKTTWAIYGGTHPKPAGNRIAADLIEDVFQQTKFSADDAKSGNRRRDLSRPLPPPIDPSSFDRGRFLGRDAITMGTGWSYVEPTWKDIAGSFRQRFAGRPLTVATVPGAELEVAFSGTAVGLFVLAGPDAGVVEFSIDDGDWQAADLFHRFSKGLHYPRTVVLKSGLDDGPHRLKLRVSKKKNEASQGNAARVLEFVAS
ncbi:GDSL-type esterase/lipase family protein [Rhodopirellula sp. JC639]|uniref:GDSL-type esterase/lipase family protein n=1 Tax=Stieleria mannarensis TaxID=2755585 RepID=UPI001601DF47|nr:GDSL-type esterase/lipase family protein [Rhodopirellula sp. JC639]